MNEEIEPKKKNYLTSFNLDITIKIVELLKPVYL